MTLPAQYAWLAKEPGPKMLLEALALYGTREWPGPSSNPEILKWVRECGIDGYRNDSIPWCGLFVSIAAKRAGWPLPLSPLWARGWRDFGQTVKNPFLGDVVVFWRGLKTGFQGHVGLYVGEDKFAYHILGGNQGNKVSIIRISKLRFLAARCPSWIVGPPANRRRIWLKANGALSQNEA